MKELVDTTVRLLMIIFEWPWQSGEVPEDWKKANVTQVFKSCKKENTGNYWPVSLTSTLIKVMEHLILESISSHMNDKKVIRRSQHGFTNNKSCLTDLIAFCHETATWMDKGRQWILPVLTLVRF
ncbi:RNA-directed DNA polymerase from mobile element jockey-like protein [Turdus rufiventris]|nr:RNA-directed DNA polymerase from mobile element jockey-like protein [Turdus rufiventris]